MRGARVASPCFPASPISAELTSDCCRIDPPVASMPDHSALFADPDLPLAVIVAATRWNEPPRMRHHLARQLMRWCNVLFLELLPNGVGRVPVSAGDRIAVASISPTGSFPQRLYSNEPLCHWLCNRRTAALVEQVVSGIPAPSRLLFNFMHSFPEVMEIRGIDARVYVCVDEFPRMWRRRTRGNPLRFFYQSRLQQWYENRVARAADLCLSPHEGLVQKLQRHCKNVELFLHASDFTEPGQAGLPEVSASENVQSTQDPSRVKVCFMGFIHYRLSETMLVEVLKQPDMTLHMIGPVAAAYDTRFFAGFSNVVWHGSTTGEALERLLRSMDVLIIPYDASIPEVSVLTSTSKLFQYIASGKPIVTAHLPCLLKLPKEVLTSAATAGEFVQRIRAAKESDSEEARRARLQIARENTWDQRGRQLCSILRNALRLDLEGGR